MDNLHGNNIGFTVGFSVLHLYISWDFEGPAPVLV